MDTRDPTCGWSRCADHDDRCAMGIKLPCVSANGEGPAAEACISDIASGYQSGLYRGFSYGVVFMIAVLAAVKIYSLFF